MTDLAAFDRHHLWHPYTVAGEAAPPVWEVTGAKGVYLELADGHRLIDGVSSWWCACLGHGREEITEAMAAQGKAFSQVMFAGFTHRPAGELAEALLARAPKNMEQVFYVDSGSVATEAMIKLACQYQAGRGRVGRGRMLTIRGGYHGDTTGAMAVSDPDGMHAMFGSVMQRNFFVGTPRCKLEDEWDDSFAADLEEKIIEHESEIAGVILEPVFQGANRMWFYHPGILRKARELCDRYDLLLMFDEVATGFGRLGTFFAADMAGVAPDVMSVGKGITAGAVGLAAVLCSGKTAKYAGAFMHGPTFMANPVACAAGVAAQRIFDRFDWRGNVRRIEAYLRKNLAPAKALANVADVRVCGAVGVIEVRNMPPLECYRERLLSNGVWLRPYGKFIYTMPPFVTTDAELGKICAMMLEIARIPSCQ